MDSQRSGLANGGGSSSAGVSTMSNVHRVVHFALSRSCALKIQKGEIAQWFVDGSSDAIVNPANERMLGGAGADGGNSEQHAMMYEKSDLEFAVPLEKRGLHRRLSYFSFYNSGIVQLYIYIAHYEHTRMLCICRGFKLPASHVIHTVGPIYNVDPNPEASLRSAYRSSLRVAKQNNIQYIAFTAISCGNHGYPLDEAATIAISTVRELANDFKEVHFVLYTDETYNVWLNKANELLHDQ